MAQAGARDLETNSYWWPLEGLCYTGEYKDEMLDPIPVVHCTWGEWKQLHPETDVLAPPQDPNQRDPRGGHGSEEYWERPGMDQLFIHSLYKGDLDRQLPENVMVMGINLVGGHRAYPMKDIKLEGGLVNDVLGGVPVLIIAGPSPESFYTGAFDRRVGDRVFEFEVRENRIVDKQTGSTWNSEGRAVEGDLKGTELQPIHSMLTRWHSWIYTHPETEVFKTKKQEAPHVELGIFERIIEGFREALHEVRVEGELLNLQRPLQSDRGLVIHIDGDRFLLHHFTGETAARDYAHFTKGAVRAGLCVLQSAPEQQFADIALNNSLLPDDEIKWSKLVGNQDFVDRFQRSAPQEDGGEDYAGFSDIVVGLNENGYDCFPGAPEMHVDIVNWSPWGTYVGLNPGAENWFTVTMGGFDPFEIHRFETVEGAQEYSAFARHAFRIGRYVFVSTPQNKFILPRFRMVDRPEEKVSWSDFLEDEDLKRILRTIIKE